MAEPPHLGSVRPGRWLGLLLFALLGAAAATALLGGPRRLGPLSASQAGAAVFAVFLLVFAIYRFTLVRAGRYSLGKSLYQVGAGVLLVLLLGLGAFAPHRADEAADLVGYLLDSSDPHVRRAGCELARLRRDSSNLAAVQAHLGDEPEVAAECQRAAEALRSAGSAAH